MDIKREIRIKKFKGSKIYQVLIDRFAGCLNEEIYSIQDLKRNRIYGNLTDLMNKLDYIKSMDFDTIWLTPFYVNQPHGNHGYHVINYNHVDPYFAFGNIEEKINDINEQERLKNKGDPLNDDDVSEENETEADKVLKEFVQKCHKKDIKVMMDFVPNHCHREHPFFNEALNNNINSVYRDWFYFGENNAYLRFLNFDELPKLNLTNENVRRHLIKSTEKFLKYGIDAVRIDHCIGPRQEDLDYIIREIHKSFPEVVFIGEILPFGCVDAPETILGMTNEELQRFKQRNDDSINDLDKIFLNYFDIIDGVLDFVFFYRVDEFVSGSLNETNCIEKLNKHFQKFNEEKDKRKKDFLLLKHLDSHDQDRIMFRCHNNIEIQQKAMELLYKDYCGRNDPLVVYYGTEDLMTQEDTIHRGDYGDYRCRLPMKFLYENHRRFYS